MALEDAANTSDPETGLLQLTKHHGLGNDFLVALNPGRPLGPEYARALCDRHTGIGADGLLVSELIGGSDHWSMTLWNADGSRAEISGNGLRCLGQAIVMGTPDLIGSEPVVDQPEQIELLISTDAGQRRLSVTPDVDPTWLVTAGMGKARPGQGPSSGWSATAVDPNDQVSVDIGNPHLVAVVDEIRSIDMAEVGPIIESEFASGMNVHCIEVVAADAINLVVWERGVGITQACGSGACAAAWAARQLGLVGDKIAVTMPGGSATVELEGDDIDLTGPATYIGRVLVG